MGTQIFWAQTEFCGVSEHVTGCFEPTGPSLLRKHDDSPRVFVWWPSSPDEVGGGSGMERTAAAGEG